MVTITHPSKTPLGRVAAKHAARPMPVHRERRAAHRERRAAHRFQRDPQAHGTGIGCLACGYAEAGHLALTDPEREILVSLVNQPHPQPFMRRSILRKLTAALRHQHR